MDVKELSSIRLKQTIANFIIPLIAVLGAVLLMAFYIYPSLKEMPALQEDLALQNELLSQLKAKSQKLSDLLDYKNNVNENLEVLGSALSGEPRVPELLTQIDLIAKESGLEVSRLNYSINDASDIGGNYDVVAVSLGVKGTYDQVTTFLSNIENSARVVSVDNIRYAFESDGNSLTVTFVLSSPYVVVNASADTDVPITFDLTATEFQAQMDFVRKLRFYNISVEDYIPVPTESTEPLDPEVEVLEDSPTDGVTINPTPEEPVLSDLPL